LSARIAIAPTLALVVPTYNERDRLPELVRAIFQRAKESVRILEEAEILEICHSHAQP